MHVELTLAQQVMVGYTSYSVDNRDRLLVGYASAAMVNGPMPVMMIVGLAPYGRARAAVPVAARALTEQQFRPVRQAVLTEIMQNPQEYSSFGVDYNYVVSLYPRWG